MSGTLPPLEHISADDHGPVVTVLVIIFACISVTSALVRVYVSIKRRLAFGIDDAFCFAALATIVSQTIVLYYAQVNGLGRHMSMLSAAEITNYFKLMYASHLVGLAVSTTFSKASVIALFGRILWARLPRVSYFCLSAMVVVWGLFSVFELAFQCNLPEPWHMVSSNCPTKGRLFYPVIILNIVTDFVLAVYIIPHISSLSMQKVDQWIVIGLFASRILVCGASVAQLVFTVQALDQTDHTWSWVKPTILESLVVNLSLITAIGPRINNYLSGLQAGLLGPQISEQEVRRYRRQLLKPVSRASKTSKSSTSALHQPSKEGEPPQPLPTDTPCSQSTKSQNAWDYSRQGKDLDEIFQLSQIASNDIITNVKKP